MSNKIMLVKVSKDLSQKEWVKHLPHPLTENEVLTVSKDQSGVTDKFIRLMVRAEEGKERVPMVFAKANFKEFEEKK